MIAKGLDEQAIFEAVRKITAGEARDAYLRQVCGEDAVLEQRVRALLGAYEQSASFLESPPSAVYAVYAGPGLTVDEPISERPGTVIGSYKLLEQIGEGGFGVVFMAEQTQPVRRKVALKVLKPGMDTQQVVARFEAERQALAIMDHTNIAKVFDGGQTASGRPYFVMELVKGTPITEFCDQNQLTPRQRLELFGSVCQAVQHAHQKGIIHRDLKPSNVLVSRHDTTPVVKVIDFGVAKALGQELTDKTLFTGIAQIIGTPLYMSPEQADMSDLDIDTRSDIYSLGVLLYELLTGTTPFNQERLRTMGYDEIRRVIREEEPPRPSTRISTLGQAATTISTQRQSDPKQLSQLMRGELDWIVMKALDKDRNRRYESASAFAADLQRYLADEPVQACPPSLGYRVRKFARRNKAGLAAAGLVLSFVTLLAGGGGWVIRDRGARGQRLTAQVEQILDEVDRLEGEQKWPEAQTAAERAAAVLVVGEGDDAVRRRVRDVRRDLAFVARLDRIRQELALQFEPRFNYRRAVPDYAQAFREYGVDVEQLPAETTVARLQSRPALAVAIASALDDWAMSRSRLDQGESSWRPLLAIASRLDPDPIRDRLRAAWGRAVTPELQAELRSLAESIDASSQSSTTLVTLAATLHLVRLEDLAFRVLRDGQITHPNDFWLNFELGVQLQSRKVWPGALRCYSACVALRPDSAAAHNNLGNALRETNDLEAAVREFHAALKIDANFAPVHNNLGSALLGKKDFKGAIREFHTALQIDPKLAQAYVNIGLALRDENHLEEAIREFHAALEIDPNYVAAHNELGLALSDKNDLDGAIREFRAALKISPNDAPAHNNLGTALQRMHDLKGAILEYRAAVKIDPNYAAPHNNLASVLRDQKDLEEAIFEYRAALKIDPNLAAAHCNLARTLNEKGEFREALEQMRLGHELGTKNPAWRHPSQEWVRQCERLVELDGKLPDFVEGKTTPVSAAERIELAELCSIKRLNLAAARFYDESFTADSKLVHDPRIPHRYNAGRAAALAGCGMGNDAGKLDDAERARLRRQALGWLRAELESWSRSLEKEPSEFRSSCVGILRYWLGDSDFAGVRGPEARAKLPEAERQAWQKLWEDVADMLKHAQGNKKDGLQNRPT